MKKLFSNSLDIEKSVKEKYAFPPFVMMENAASALADEIIKVFDNDNYDDVLIVCGKGNNGADGLAVARKLYWKLPVKVCYLGNDSQTMGQIEGSEVVFHQNEAATQLQMAIKIGVPFISKDDLKSFSQNKSGKYIIVDCVFGTGFHGELSNEYAEIIDLMNNASGFKIACDIPSGLKFKADSTVTMGTLKTILYSDEAKDFCGEIKLAELGIAESVFEKDAEPDAYLLEENDIKLPVRTEKKTHKGKFGHAVIVAGEKSGAGIMAAEASLNFGAGLVSILETPCSNLSQFKISPELMITNEYPQKATAVLIGSGFGTKEKNLAEKKTSAGKTVNLESSKSRELNVISDFIEWFKSTQNPACVIDADFFSLDFSNLVTSCDNKNPNLAIILTELNSVPNARIVLTPHAKELCDIYEKCLSTEKSDSAKTFDSTIKKSNSNADIATGTNNFTPDEILNHRIEIGKLFTEKYPNITLVMKGSNTFIASKGEVYIFDGGAQSLAKGGSGDILAGMITSLLAQGYTAKEAAITAVYRHGTAASEFGANAYNLTPKKLLNLI